MSHSDRTITMARRKQETNTERIELRTTEAWITRVEEAARRKNISTSSYIRMVVTERMDQDGIPELKKAKDK